MGSLKIVLAALMLSGAVTTMTGCGAQPGTTILTQNANSDPVMGTALQSGEYMLYTSASMNPTVTVRLKAGDPLGFRRSSEGRMQAIAGDQSFDMPTGYAQAYWKLQNP